MLEQAYFNYIYKIPVQITGAKLLYMYYYYYVIVFVINLILNFAEIRAFFNC
jgi:hypothetical protein